MTDLYNEMQRLRRLVESAERASLAEAPAQQAPCPTYTAQGQPSEIRKKFNQAFALARKQGAKEFIFNGKKYTTQMAPQQSAQNGQACKPGQSVDSLRNGFGGGQQQTPQQGGQQPTAPAQQQPQAAQSQAQPTAPAQQQPKAAQSQAQQQPAQQGGGQQQTAPDVPGMDEFMNRRGSAASGSQTQQGGQPAPQQGNAIMNDPPTAEQWGRMNPQAQQNYLRRKGWSDYNPQTQQGTPLQWRGNAPDAQSNDAGTQQQQVPKFGQNFKQQAGKFMNV